MYLVTDMMLMRCVYKACKTGGKRGGEADAQRQEEEDGVTCLQLWI